MQRVCLLLTVLGLVWGQAALAGVRLVQVGSEPIPVYVKAGIPVAVTFPERIAAIPTGADPADLSLEIEGKRLFIQSLVEGFDARIFVIGASGRMVQLHVTERAGEPDDRVQLVRPAAPPVFGAESPAEQRVAAARRGRKRASPLRRLLVAMIEGEGLPGVSVVDHAQTLFDDGAVAIRTLQVYAAGRYLGYVAVAENRGTEPVALRLPEYQAAGLRAIAAHRETLAPRGTTLVYLVVEAARAGRK